MVNQVDAPKTKAINTGVFRLFAGIFFGVSLVAVGFIWLGGHLQALWSVSAFLAVTIPSVLFVVAARGAEPTWRSLLVPVSGGKDLDLSNDSAEILADIFKCSLFFGVLLSVVNFSTMRDFSSETIALALMNSLPGILYALLTGGLLLLPAQQSIMSNESGPKTNPAQVFLSAICLTVAVFVFFFSAVTQGASVGLFFSFPSFLVVCGPIAAVWITTQSLCHTAIKNLFLASIFGGLLGFILAIMSTYGDSDSAKVMRAACAPLIYGAFASMYFRLWLGHSKQKPV